MMGNELVDRGPGVEKQTHYDCLVLFVLPCCNTSL